MIFKYFLKILQIFKKGLDKIINNLVIVCLENIKPNNIPTRQNALISPLVLNKKKQKTTNAAIIK